MNDFGPQVARTASHKTLQRTGKIRGRDPAYQGHILVDVVDGKGHVHVESWDMKDVITDAPPDAPADYIRSLPGLI